MFHDNRNRCGAALGGVPVRARTSGLLRFRSCVSMLCLGRCSCCLWLQARLAALQVKEGCRPSVPTGYPRPCIRAFANASVGYAKYSFVQALVTALQDSGTAASDLRFGCVRGVCGSGGTWRKCLSHKIILEEERFYTLQSDYFLVI